VDAGFSDVGESVGASVVGLDEGESLESVGVFVGAFVGTFVGAFVGAFVGTLVGTFVGAFVGAFVGTNISSEGAWVGGLVLKFSHLGLHGSGQ